MLSHENVAGGSSRSEWYKPKLGRSAVTYLGALTLVGVVPFVIGGKFAFSIGAEVAIYALALMGLSILYGWAGQLSLAHAGFFGLGAYTTAFLKYWTAELTAGVSIELVSVIAVASMAGLVVGLPAVRISGLQLAIVTLAFAEVFQWALLHFSSISGGTQGLLVGSLEIGPYSTFDGQVRFTMAMGLAAVGGLFMLSLQQTPLGRAMWAIRDTELAARSVGVRPAAVKLVAFVIGAIYAAIAGWMFAYHAFAVTPGHFTLFSNVFLLLAIVIGGRHSLLGAWLGALYLVVIPELVRSLGGGNLYPVISGLLLILVVLLAPRGFADLFAKLAKRLKANFTSTEDTELASDHQWQRAGLGLAKRETANSSSTSLKVKDVTVNFAGIAALKRVTADFPRGVSGLIGPNGAGKTTLLNVMTGYVQPSHGQVELDNEVLTGLASDELARRGIVRSFQTVRLMDGESVLTNILLGRYRNASSWSFAQICGLPQLRTRECEDRAAATEMALLLGLELTDLNRPTNELPFGARRLVEIGRVLVSHPPVVLLDEPASGLTRSERNHLATFLRKYASDRPIIMILTEHDVDLVRQLCERLVVLDSGAIIATGTPKDALADARVRQAYFGSTG